ncbi:MAG: PAS domain-containing protein [Shimia sp.]
MDDYTPDSASQLETAEYGADDRIVIDLATAGSNNMLVSLLASTDDCVKVLNADGSLEHMSCNGRRAMEVENFDDLRGAMWPELWPRESQDTLHEALDAAREGKTAEFEAFCPTAKGTPRWWSVSVVPVPDYRDELCQIVVTSRDITDRVKRERDLRIQTAQLQATVRVMKRLLQDDTSSLDPDRLREVRGLIAEMSDEPREAK